MLCYKIKGGVNVIDKPKKAVWDSCLDEPIAKGKPVDIKTLKAMKQAVIRAREISKRQNAENEREARQFFKGRTIK